MYTLKQKGIVLGCLLFMTLVIGLVNFWLMVIGLFAMVPLGYKVMTA